MSNQATWFGGPVGPIVDPVPVGIYRMWPNDGTLGLGPYPNTWIRAVPIEPIEPGFTGDYPAPIFEPLPQIQVESINHYMGPRPPDASFRYRISDIQPLVPTWFDRLMNPHPLDQAVLSQNDRIVVVGFTALGEPRFLFDGFVQMPELALSDKGQEIPIQAVGIPVRCFDNVISGSWRRHSIQFTDPATDRYVDLEARFNPEGRPNSTGQTPDYPGTEESPIESRDRVSISGMEHPVFIDEFTFYNQAQSNQNPRGPWQLGPAIRYIMGAEGDARWVRLPHHSVVDQGFQTVTPAQPGVPIHPNDPSTYVLHSIQVADLSIAGMQWPEALEQLVTRHGYRMRWRLGTGFNGWPRYLLSVIPTNTPRPHAEKIVYRQPAGQMIEPTLTNMHEAQLQRDPSKMVSLWTVPTARIKVQVGLKLVPGWVPDAADLTVENKRKFLLSNLDANTDLDKYRLFVFNETGEGYWSQTAQEWASAPDLIPDLTPVFKTDREWLNRFVVRRRQALKDLLTLGPQGEKLNARLYWIQDLTNTLPGIFKEADQPDVTKIMQLSGGFEILEDRIGIRVTAEDPEEWNAGEHEEKAKANAGTLRLLTWTAHDDASVEPPALPKRKNLVLLLVCTLEADMSPRGLGDAGARQMGIYQVWREQDASNRYEVHHLHESAFGSGFHPDGQVQDADGNPLGYQVIRDDTAKAQAEAEARVAASNHIPLAGRFGINRLTNAYEVGDRIVGVQGINFHLRTNGSTGEWPTYPVCVQITWTFQDGQRTSLHWSDSRMDT